jgi:hypothetical protein
MAGHYAMEHEPLVKIPDSRAATIAKRCSLSYAASQLLTDEMTPAEFVAALAAGRHYVAAIDFMAHALPARESVWWSCLAIQHAFGDKLAGTDREACRAAVQWVLKPTEENRLAARAPGDAAGPASPAGAAAMAASIGGQPGPYPSARPVTTAVKLAAIKGNPAKVEETQLMFIQLALGIAAGRYM